MITTEHALRIQSALSKSGNEYDINDVEERVMSGHAQMWEAEDTTVVTEIVDYPNFRSFNVWLASGELDGIIGLLPGAVRYAKAHGCTRLELTGRPGWKRALAAHGFVEKAIVLTKDI